MDKVAMRVTSKPIKRSRVGDVVYVTPDEAKTMRALGLGEDVDPARSPKPREPEPPAKRGRGRPKGSKNREKKEAKAPDHGRYSRRDMRPEK